MRFSAPDAGFRASLTIGRDSLLHFVLFVLVLTKLIGLSPVRAVRQSISKSCTCIRRLRWIYAVYSSLVGRFAPNPVRTSTSPPLAPNKLKIASQSLARAAPKRCIRLVAVRLSAGDNCRLGAGGACIATLLTFLAPPDDYGACD